MIRNLIAAAAAGTLLLPVAALAQNGAYYSATPATASAKAQFIASATVWTCGGASCVASKGDSRDAIMCQLVARELGKLAAFTAGGTAFDAAALEKCNARAK